MPSLGADMDSGRVVDWLVKPGDMVSRGQIVANIHTLKALLEAEIWVSGVVKEILVDVGQDVPVGTPLLLVETTEEIKEEETPTLPKEALVSQIPASAEKVGEQKEASPLREEARIRISPVAKKLAEERKVDIATMKGSGPQGAITREDIEAALRQAPGERQIDERASMQLITAKLMARSKREIPHYYLEMDVELSQTLKWLEQENLKRPVTERILPAALFLLAVARAARKTPDFNGFLIDDKFRYVDTVHLGVAISLRGGGLVAPALRDAHQMNLSTLMEALRSLVNHARQGKLRISEMSEPTITVTNIGEEGVQEIYGVIYPPQVALVGFGRIAQVPWVENNEVVARPVVKMTLSGDHRVSDGIRGSRFLLAISRLLQQPEKLMTAGGSDD